MSLKYYQSSLPILPATPSDIYKQDYQALVDQQFSNASTYTTIEEELTIGTLVFSNINVRLSHDLKATFSGKIADDCRKLVFRITNGIRDLGYRFRFENNIWLTINQEDDPTVATSCIVRKCNYTLNWYNVNRQLISEPCIIDYFKLSDDDAVQERQNIRIGEDVRYTILQSNSETLALIRDDTFIIDGRKYRIINYDNITKLGLTQLTLEETQLNTTTDDIINKVTDKTVPVPIPAEDTKLW